jgi:hypothetical protein
MDVQHFATLLSKFEQLVERLERVEKAQGITQGITNGAPVAQAAPAKAAPASSGNSQLNGLLKDFDNEVLSKVKAFEDAANTIGGEIVPKIVRSLFLVA